MIRFRNKSFGSKLKAHFFSNLFNFETQPCESSFKKCAWSSKLNKFEKKCALEDPSFSSHSIATMNYMRVLVVALLFSSPVVVYGKDVSGKKPCCFSIIIPIIEA